MFKYDRFVVYTSAEKHNTYIHRKFNWNYCLVKFQINIKLFGNTEAGSWLQKAKSFA